MVSWYSIRRRLYLSPRILVRVRTLEIGKGEAVAARQQKTENAVDSTDTLKNDSAEQAGH